eukprot:gene29666-36748_t
MTIKKPHTPGYDFSGVIESVAPDVTTGFKIGDEVFSMNWLLPNTHNNEFGESGGAFAEYIQFPVTHLVKKPPNVSHTVAAALPMVGLTGEVPMRMTNIQAGSKVLIIGGSSAVGSIAIQCAKRRGAHVTTTCSTRAMNYVSQFGADKIINYNEKNWWEELSDLDFVCDAVGGSFISLVDISVGYFLDSHRPRFRLAGFWGSGVQDIFTKVARWNHRNQRSLKKVRREGLQDRLGLGRRLSPRLR